ncbi:MAG: class B sortase [Clostridiaceae bacterium]|nr:class B sortase [Clostridiaceae bacterium]
MSGRKKLLIFVLLGVFIVSSYVLTSRYMGYKKGEKLYEEAIDKYVITPPENKTDDSQDDLPEASQNQPESPVQKEPAASALTMDFDALSKLNTDIIGWIKIPDTNINYPLLQGDTNDTYLRHAYNGTYSRMGSIFMDYRCSPDFSGSNTIIYGHNMRNSTMFSRLLKYENQSFFESHPYFYIYTAEGYMKYAIFSCYMLTLPSDTYTIAFNSDKVFGDYITTVLARSSVSTGTIPSESDKLVTLSTCSSTNAEQDRFVVHGYLVEDSRASSTPAP